LNPNLPTTAPKNVVAQLSWGAADAHFPMLILGTNTYYDFTFSTHFKIMDGLTEQSAGVAFRVQDERNYYFVRADALANKLYFGGMAKGVPHMLYGEDMSVSNRAWHDLTVRCEGVKITISLDGKEMRTASDPTYASGRIGFWTKSDTICYFTDTSIRYVPRLAAAQEMVSEVMKEEPKLVGLQVAMVPPKGSAVRVVASNNEKEIGGPGEKTDADVIKSGLNYYRKEKGVVYVTMPLRDRNGDVEAAVRVAMKSFFAETQGNALERALPIVKKMQERAVAVDSLY
jgi:hypothetical protein